MAQKGRKSMQEQQKQAPLPLARQPVSSWDWTVSQSIWKEGGRSGWEWSSLTQEPTAVELASLSQVGGSLDTLAPPSLAQESGACSGRGNLTVAAPSGQRGPAFSTAGWCLFLAQEAALPSGKIEKKKKEKKTSVLFFTQPLLLKAPGWCRPASVGTEPPSLWQLTHWCPQSCQLCGGGETSPPPDTHWGMPCGDQGLEGGTCWVLIMGKPCPGQHPSH